MQFKDAFRAQYYLSALEKENSGFQATFSERSETKKQSDCALIRKYLFKKDSNLAEIAK